MDRKNVRTMVNLTGGTGAGPRGEHPPLRRARTRAASPPSPSLRTASFKDPRYPQIQADAIQQAKKAGARGLKVLKTLGLFLREDLTTGPLVKIDDKRFDPDVGRLRRAWDCRCGSTSPTRRRSSSPPTASTSATRSCRTIPTGRSTAATTRRNAEIMAARDRVFARHPKTKFLRAARGQRRREPRLRLRDPRPLPQHVGGDGRARRRARPPAARVAEVLREVPGPHPVRHRRRAAAVRQRDAAAGLRRRAVRDLLPLPGDRGRVLRLRARAGAAAGPLADLRHRPAGAHPEEGLREQRGALPGAARRDRGRWPSASPWPLAAAAPAKPRYDVASTSAAARRAPRRRRRGLEGRAAHPVGTGAVRDRLRRALGGGRALPALRRPRSRRPGTP